MRTVTEESLRRRLALSLIHIYHGTGNYVHLYGNPEDRNELHSRDFKDWEAVAFKHPGYLEDMWKQVYIVARSMMLLSEMERYGWMVRTLFPDHRDPVRILCGKARCV